MTDSETETGGEEGVETSNPVKYDTSKVIEDPDRGLHRFSTSDRGTPLPKKVKKKPKTKELKAKLAKKRKRTPQSPVEIKTEPEDSNNEETAPKPKKIKVKINKPNFGKPKKKTIRTKKPAPKETENSDSDSSNTQESPITRQQRKQWELYYDTSRGRDQRARIKARQNENYERVNLPGRTDIGERGTRRRVMDCKDPPTKPSKLKDIPYIYLSSSDEEPNTRAHPKSWIGREIQQTELDEAMKLVNPINYIRLPGSFGNLPGNFEVIKIEPKTDSDDNSDRVRTSQEEDDPMKNLNNYVLEETTGGRELHTKEPTKNEEQIITPQPGTSSGAAT